VRIVMYVLNDVSHDSRVRREATTLAAAGHEVTIVATPLADGDGDGSEALEGVTIRRVAIPTGTRWWVTAVRAPWRLRPLGVLLLLPWVVVRGLWVVTVNRIFGRPVRAGGIDYIRRWRVEWLGWCRAAVTAAPAADVHHAHDMEALPAARAAAARDRARYVYDSHEIHMSWGPVLRQPRLLRRIVGRWEARLARGAAAVVTVNEAVGVVLRQRLGLRRVAVVHNCVPTYSPHDPPDDRIRKALGLPLDTRIVLCHGAFMANRGLLETAAAMLDEGLREAHLVFLGYGQGYLAGILADPRLHGRVHLLPPVPADEVTAWVAGSDVVVIAIGTVTENGRLSTPNKLFEAIAAGVPMVVSDFGPMRSIVLDQSRGPLGALCDPSSPASIASAISSILDLDPPARAELRSRILRAAHERWNWETESEKLLGFYRELAATA
jgi:glycogen synthase